VTHHHPPPRACDLSGVAAEQATVSQTQTPTPTRPSRHCTPLPFHRHRRHYRTTQRTRIFFNRVEWPVNAILDPKDTNPQRYAILAVLTALMCRAFNRLAEKRLPRDAPPITWLGGTGCAAENTGRSVAVGYGGIGIGDTAQYPK
jgi:hypothetical protein